MDEPKPYRSRARDLIPFVDWARERPWKLGLVRWFLFFTLFPLLLVAWGQQGRPAFDQVAFLFGIYFAAAWGVAIHLFIQPERISWVDIARVSLFTGVTGVVLMIWLVQFLPGMALLRAAAETSPAYGRLLANVVGVGIPEETVKAIPIWWIFLRNREPGTIREIVFLGCVSGFAFGVSESVSYSILYANSLGQGNLGLEQYLLVQYTRLITLPLLHAVFSGIVAYSVGLSLSRGKRRWHVVLAGLLWASLLHGLYDTFTTTPLGFLVAIAALLTFVSYVRRMSGLERAA